MSVIPPEKLKPFRFLREREICNADKAFVLRIMKLDPRDRPTAKDRLQYRKVGEDGGMDSQTGAEGYALEGQIAVDPARFLFPIVSKSVWKINTLWGIISNEMDLQDMSHVLLY